MLQCIKAGNESLVYSIEEQEEAIKRGGRLYSKSWRTWIDSCCSQFIDCEIDFTCEMTSAYALSKKLSHLLTCLIWGIKHAEETAQPAENLYFLNWLYQAFQETFAIWFDNWLNFGPLCYYWHPFARACLGPIMDYWPEEC